MFHGTPFRVLKAVEALHQGSIIAYPTEAVWGLGCDPLNPEAVADLLRLKDRPASKGLILVASDLEQLLPFIGNINADQTRKLQDSWPGPVTWLVPAHPRVPVWLRGEHATIAVRVSAHPTVQALCKHAGSAIVSTSANPAGLEPARNLLQLQRYFGQRHVTVVPGRLGAQSRPTSIIDLQSGEVIRQ